MSVTSVGAPMTDTELDQWRRHGYLEMESVMTVTQSGNPPHTALQALMAVWTLGRRLLTRRAWAAIRRKYGCSDHR